MKTLNLVMMLFFYFLLVACSFDKNNPSAEKIKQREKDRDQLKQQYDQITGKYVGQLIFFDRPQNKNVDVELSLYIKEENAGMDTDGRPITRPTLKAYFKRADALNLGLVFMADFPPTDPNKQNLILNNPTVVGENSTLSSQEISSIRGSFQNDSIECLVYSESGEIGKMSLKLSDKSTEASSLGIQSDLNEKILKLYQRIEGTYEGSIYVEPSALNPILSRITLSATLNQLGKPELKAYFERLDLYPVLDFNHELVVDFKTETYPQKISFVSKSGSGFNFVGTMNADTYCGVDTCPLTIQGDLVLAKNIKTAVRFSRMTHRTQPQNSDVVGKYEGQLELNDRPGQIGPTLEFSIFVQEETGGVDNNGQSMRRPVLKAYIKRLDTNSIGSIYSVSYNDLANPETYNLVIYNPSNPSIDIISLRGKFINSLFEAEVLSRNGIIGRVSLKWLDKNPHTPSDNLENQNNSNLLKNYKTVEGTYEGFIQVPNSALNPILSRVTLTATTNQAGKPELKAFYERLDQYPVLDFNQDLVVDFKTDTFPQKISLVSKSGSGFNFEGQLKTDEKCSKEPKGPCPPLALDLLALEGDLVLTKNIKTKVLLKRLKDRPNPLNSEIIGRYKGSLKLNDRPGQAGPSLELSIFTQEELGGIDSQGQPLRKAVLKAYIKRADNFAGGSIYSVSYNDLANPENYNLVIYNPSNPNLDIVSLRGKFVNAVFVAEALSRNGIIGTVSMKWLDKTPQAPSDNLDNQNSENLLKIYKTIEGSYEGTVDVFTKDIKPFPIRISLNATMTVGNKPVIRAYYERLDVPSGDLSLDLDVDYRPDTFPQRITMTSLINGSPRAYFFNFEGILRPQNPIQIVGTLLLPKNRKADVILTRKK